MKKSEKFNPSDFESRWQKIWEEKGVYQPSLTSPKSRKPPYYNLMMFPYPSAEGLHVGNVYAFTGVDIHGRFMRMKGFDVFEPIGLDGFGIHSENYALKVGRHPKEQAKISEANFYRQLGSIGNGFAWKNRLETYDPEYYKWTQWIFVQMFKHGLAYRKKSSVNFCPSCKTVLSDEQVIDGKCERCKSEVGKKEMEQWFFKITDYAERLLQNTFRKDFNWTEKVKIGQRNWIGRSGGVRIEFKIQNSKFKMEIFTTAIDTIFGTTFMVLSPDHPLVDKLEVPKDYLLSVKNYIEDHKKRTVSVNQSEDKEKTGVFTGLYAFNPFNNEKIPIWIADYVLMDYGTGAIMGVPGHDARDHEFAKKFGLKIIPVIKPSNGIKDRVKVENDGFWDYPEIKIKFADQSVVFNSGFLGGLTSNKAKKKLEDEIEKRGLGKKVVTYKLRDWCISRQRYWGAPIPMIFCSSCAKSGKDTSKVARRDSSDGGGKKDDSMVGWIPVPEKDLPVLLPDLKDWKPEGTGKGPLAKLKDFVKVKCPKCGGEAERETDVCDTFLDSSWYFLRYPSINLQPTTHNPQLPWDSQITRTWLPVHSYIGGAEHTVLHLLYSRFVTMAFKDWGLLDFEEPYKRFYAHGLIIAEGAKMSKSRGNVIIPDEYIRKYGADTLRSYLMFLGPFDAGGDFRDTGIAGMHRFLGRVWRLVTESLKDTSDGGRQAPLSGARHDSSEVERLELTRLMHHTIKKVTVDLENLRYNTAIAHIMEFVNHLTESLKDTSDGVPMSHRGSSEVGEAVKVLLLLLAPFAPHMAEELWSRYFVLKQPKQLKLLNSIHIEKWPTYDEKYLVESEVTIVVQINGKTRDILKIQNSKSNNQNEIEKIAKESEKAEKHFSGKTIKKVIFVPGKLINFVVRN